MKKSKEQVDWVLLKKCLNCGSTTTDLERFSCGGCNMIYEIKESSTNESNS